MRWSRERSSFEIGLRRGGEGVVSVQRSNKTYRPRSKAPKRVAMEGSQYNTVEHEEAEDAM